MRQIKIDDWSKVTDELMAFLWGLDDAVERSIVRYLYDNPGWIPFENLRKYAMEESLICFNQSTLSRRLTSLVKFEIIERIIEHDNKTYYRLNTKFHQELLLKKEGYF